MTEHRHGLPPLMTAVAEALELPQDDRSAHLDTRCPDPAQRAKAARLLRACEEAEENRIFEQGAAELAAPFVAEVEEQESQVPPGLAEALAGSYTIERELGRGGMATVYLARDARHGRFVALKVLRPELVPHVGPPLAAARFKQEIEFAAGLSHPHILPLHDSGAAGGHLYFITPYIEGETLQERLRRSGPPPLPEALRLLRDITRALAYAHGRGVIHRDIKPANILLTQDGDALVADFGVAKGLAAAQDAAVPSRADLTDGSLVLGTPAYMAPEQITRSSGVDQRADLYALGALAYEVLTGEAPFAGRPRHEQLAAHVAELPEPLTTRRPDVPEPLADLVQRLLAKRTDDRPEDASEVLRVLDSAAVAGEATRRPSAPRRTARWLVALVAVTALVAAAAAVMLTQQRMAEGAAPVSLAVLPFGAVGDSDDAGELAIGLGNAISTDLGRLRHIVVPGYLTTSRYRGHTDSLARVGSRLGVGTLLTGTMDRSDDRVRVDVQLVDAGTGARRWSREFEGPVGDLLEVERQIVLAVLSELGVRPSADEREALDHAATTDGRAYELYLRARATELAGARIWLPVPSDILRRAQALYAQARDLDPRFAAARARLARIHTLAAQAFDPTDARREQARLEAEAALRLRPGLPEAHEALAFYRTLVDDADGAVAELGRALEGFPNSADLHLALNEVYADAGRLEDALAESEEAMRLDPGSALAPFEAATIYGRLRRREEAMRAFNRAIELAPDLYLARVIKGHSYLRWRGTADTLAAEMRQVPEDWDPAGMATYGRYTALWVQRRYAEALAMLDASPSEISHDTHMYQPISLMRARVLEDMGQRELARASYATALAVLRDSAEARPAEANIRISLAMAHAGLGRRVEALGEARRALELARVGTRTTVATAVMGPAIEVYAMTGEFDAAFDMIELMLSMPAGREATIPYLRVWPGFDPLRGDPRFAALMERSSDAAGDTVASGGA